MLQRSALERQCGLQATLTGVLAPNAKLRPLVVTQRPLEQGEPAVQAAAAAECEVETVQARPGRISWARLLERVFSYDVT
jgi:hypothetical protein